MLDRIERLDPQLNAYRVVFAERALLEAGQADARRGPATGGRCSASPSPIKDDVDVAGRGDGVRHARARRPAQRATPTSCARLRDAGAVVVGKTNVPELMMLPVTETLTFGATRNPWVAGPHARAGRAAGRGAAVAAGLAASALGSDGAGSIRIPAAFCGLFGIKPQRGRDLDRAAGGAAGTAFNHTGRWPAASPTPRCSST